MRIEMGWSVFHHLLLLLFGCGVSRACIGNGRLSIRQPRNEPPLVFKQHVPNAMELSPDAAGKTELRIRRHSPRFRRLAFNNNSDIVFKDEEMALLRRWMVPLEDHYMTLRCKEKLDYLAILVKNTWPGIKVRVVEAWDQQGIHAADSLHYEGRALDLTTSDRSKAKLGLLARRAVQAGFDYVYYESRNHIHASCKSDYATSQKRAFKCFPGSSSVQTANGVVQMKDLVVGDRVLALNSKEELVESPVIAFLDRQPGVRTRFLRVHLLSNTSITLTPNHLIYRDKEALTKQKIAVLASELGLGDRLWTLDGVFPVVRIEEVEEIGAYAPLTAEGTIVVERTLASCYANVRLERFAHAAMFPLRLWQGWKTADGIHPYASALLRAVQWLQLLDINLLA